MSSRVNKSRTTSGDIKPNFYTKVKRSCQKVSLEKPENLKRKFYQRKEDGIRRRRTLTRMLTVTTQTLLGVNRRVTQTQTSTHDQRYRIQSKGRRHNVFQKKLEPVTWRQTAPSQQGWVTKDCAEAWWRTTSIEHAIELLRWFARRDKVSNHPSKEACCYQINCEVRINMK